MPQPWKLSAQTMALTNYTVWCARSDLRVLNPKRSTYMFSLMAILFRDHWSTLKVCATSRSKKNVWDETIMSLKTRRRDAMQHRHCIKTKFS